MKNINNYQNNIPKELMEKEQWLAYKKIPRQNPNGEIKISKIPYSALTLSAKSWNAKENLASFNKALSVLVHHDFDGLAFALTEDDPYVCIDLDHCVKDGELSVFAKSIMRTFEGSYMELSGSLEGVHIFLKGKVPSNLNQQTKGIEIYHSNRCIAMTGEVNSRHFESSFEILDKTVELQELYDSLKAKPIGYEEKSYAEASRNLNDLPDASQIIETMCTVNFKARDYFFGSNLSEDWSKDDFNFLLLLRSFTHGDSKLMESIFLESALSRLGSKAKRRSDEGYLKYLRASIQKVNRIGHSDFWNYNFKKLTQKETTL